jgi:hypothetical protein
MVLCLMHLFHWYLIGGGKLATACADPQPRSVDRRWVDDGGMGPLGSCWCNGGVWPVVGKWQLGGGYVRGNSGLARSEHAWGVMVARERDKRQQEVFEGH